MKAHNLSLPPAFEGPSQRSTLTPYPGGCVRLADDDPVSQARLVFPGSPPDDGPVRLRRLLIDDGLPSAPSPDEAIPLDRIQPFLNAISRAHTLRKIRENLIALTHEMGFQYVALAPYLLPKPASGTRLATLDNYPPGLIDDYWAPNLSLADPIVEACLHSQAGFLWSTLPNLICMSDRQMRMLSRLRNLGVAEGFTVPQHYPGDVSGSCSFVTQIGRPFPSHNLAVAQLVAAFSVEAVRRVAGWTDRDASEPVAWLDRRRMDRVRIVTCDSTDPAAAAAVGLGPASASDYLAVVNHLCEGIDLHHWIDPWFHDSGGGPREIPGDPFSAGKMLVGTWPAVAYDCDGWDDRGTRGGCWRPSFHDFCGKPLPRFSASARAGDWGTTLDLRSLAKEPARNRGFVFILSFPRASVIGMSMDGGSREDPAEENFALPADRLTSVYLGIPPVSAEPEPRSGFEWHADDVEMDVDSEEDEALPAGRLSALYFGHRKVGQEASE